MGFDIVDLGIREMTLRMSEPIRIESKDKSGKVVLIAYVPGVLEIVPQTFSDAPQPQTADDPSFPV
jgi:hypothetical protein